MMLTESKKTTRVHSENGWARFNGLRVLLLQGPHGYFFQRVAKILEQSGAAHVTKIDFNGGDQLFSVPGAHAFRDTMQQWPDYLRAFIQQNAIDCVIVFGDCRPIHVAARGVAHEMGLQFWAFEEGYVRPHFLTLEPHGVNGNSRLPAERATYDAWPMIALDQPREVPSSFWYASWYSVCYFAAAILMRWRFLHYQHHRPVRVMDGIYWLRSLQRKWIYAFKERAVLRDLNGWGGDRPYFLSILQVALDAQVGSHSRYKHISDYIDETVRSFAKHAPERSVLLIKHHPLDRGYSDYSREIKLLTESLGIGERVRYIHDQHLPQLMSHAEGLVTINSTVGLSAMDHGLAVKTMGDAVYDLPGLTSQRPLDDFWKHAQQDKPESLLHQKFLNYVISHTQINGNFYRELPGPDAGGLRYKVPSAIHVSPLFAQLNKPSRIM